MGKARESYVKMDGPHPSGTGKTLIWYVFTKEGAGPLGAIRWFGRWRCYAFWPNEHTIYERWCLRDIADFCERQTQEHKAHG